MHRLGGDREDATGGTGGAGRGEGRAGGVGPGGRPGQKLGMADQAANFEYTEYETGELYIR